MKNKNTQKGFSLFIALTVASALLFVAYAVSKIATRGLEFAGTGRDSQIAFFAADAGIECALYWDAHAEPSEFDGAAPGSPIICGGVNMNGTNMATGDVIAGTTTVRTCIGGASCSSMSAFGFTLDHGPNPSNACVVVLVTKIGNSTSVNSFGYNTCDTNNTRRVERGVEVSY